MEPPTIWKLISSMSIGLFSALDTALPKVPFCLQNTTIFIFIPDLKMSPPNTATCNTKGRSPHGATARKGSPTVKRGTASPPPPASPQSPSKIKASPASTAPSYSPNSPSYSPSYSPTSVPAYGIKTEERRNDQRLWGDDYTSKLEEWDMLILTSLSSKTIIALQVLFIYN